MYQQSVMRKPSILSTTPPIRRDPSPSARGKKGDAPRPGALLFDACEIGVVLRAVLLVEATVAVVALFLTSTPTAWLVLAGSITGGALPATLHWLVATCASRKLMARGSHRVQYAAGVGLGAVSALYGYALLRLSDVVGACPGRPARGRQRLSACRGPPGGQPAPSPTSAGSAERRRSAHTTPPDPAASAAT